MWRADPDGPGSHPNGRRRSRAARLPPPVGTATVRGSWLCLAPIAATAADLAPPVAAALATAEPDPGMRSVTVAAGIPFSSIAWGAADGTPARPHPRRHRVGPDLVARRAGPRGDRSTGRGGRPARPRPDRPLDRTPPLPRDGGGRRGLDPRRRPRRPGAPGRRPQLGRDDRRRAARRRHPPATLVLLDPPADPARGHARGWRATRPRSAYPDLDAAVAAVDGGQPGAGTGTTSRPRPRPSSSWTRRPRERSSSTTATGTAASPTCSDPAADGIPTWIVRGDPTAGGLMPDASARRPAARMPRPCPRSPRGSRESHDPHASTDGAPRAGNGRDPAATTVAAHAGPPRARQASPAGSRSARRYAST